MLSDPQLLKRDQDPAKKSVGRAQRLCAEYSYRGPPLILRLADCTFCSSNSERTSSVSLRQKITILASGQLARQLRWPLRVSTVLLARRLGGSETYTQCKSARATSNEVSPELV